MAVSVSKLLAAAGLLLAGSAQASGSSGNAPEEPGRSFTDCAVLCPSMTIIPAGHFVMGSEAGEEGRPEWPAHEVAVARAFALGTMEISNAEYAAFVAETGYSASSGCRSLNPDSMSVEANPGATFREPGAGAGDGAAQMPAVCISWTDANAYLKWLSDRTGKTYRLPTEAEWEYAARAGSASDYPWGTDAAKGCSTANVLDIAGDAAWFAKRGIEPTHAACDDGFAGAAPVGSLAPNAFGLHDMIGNVWEWTQDCYRAPYSDDAPRDGSAYLTDTDCGRRAVRGGSWITESFRNRSSWRGRDPVDQVSWIFGFRVARDLDAGEF